MNILDKLKKLITIRDHPNTTEEEVYNAAQAITRLLYKYNLEESDIPMEEKILNPIICKEIAYKTKLCGGKWYASLVAVITNNNLGKCLIISVPNDKSGRLTRDKFQIIGRRTNVELIEYMIDSYSNKFYNIGKRYYKSYQGNLTENKFLRSFLEGCAAGLNRKYWELQKSYEACKSLIVTNENDINKYLELRNIKPRAGRSSKEQINYDAYSSGYEVGKNTDVNKGINNGNKYLLK